MAIEFNVNGTKKSPKKIYTQVNGQKKLVTKVLCGTRNGVKSIYNYQDGSKLTYLYISNEIALLDRYLLRTDDFITSVKMLDDPIFSIQKKGDLYYAFVHDVTLNDLPIRKVYISSDKQHWNVSIPTFDFERNHRYGGTSINMMVVGNKFYYLIQDGVSTYRLMSSENGVDWTNITVPGASYYYRSGSYTLANVQSWGMMEVDGHTYFAMYSNNPREQTNAYFSYGDIDETVNKIYSVDGVNDKYAASINSNEIHLMKNSAYRRFYISDGVLTMPKKDTSITFNPNPLAVDGHIYGFSGNYVRKDGNVLQTMDNAISSIIKRKEGGIIVFDSQNNMYSIDENDNMESLGIAMSVPLASVGDTQVNCICD